MKLLGIMFMAVLLAIAPSYGSAQAPQAKTPTTQTQSPEVKGGPAGTAKSFTPEERRSYENKTATELEAIQQQISGLRAQANTGSTQMKHLLIRRANNLQVQKLGASHQLAALKKASGTAWDQQKANLDKTMKRLRRALGQQR